LGETIDIHQVLLDDLGVARQFGWQIEKIPAAENLNLLAFRIPNVVFSFVAGALLLFLGSWGRFSGRLPDDNPYRQERHQGDHPDALPTTFHDPHDIQAARELADAERAVAQHTAPADVAARIDALREVRSPEERVQRWRAGHA